MRVRAFIDGLRYPSTLLPVDDNNVYDNNEEEALARRRELLSRLSTSPPFSALCAYLEQTLQTLQSSVLAHYHQLSSTPRYIDTETKNEGGEGNTRGDCVLLSVDAEETAAIQLVVKVRGAMSVLAGVEELCSALERCIRLYLEGIFFFGRCCFL